MKILFLSILFFSLSGNIAYGGVSSGSKLCSAVTSTDIKNGLTTCSLLSNPLTQTFTVPENPYTTPTYIYTKTYSPNTQPTYTLVDVINAGYLMAQAVTAMANHFNLNQGQYINANWGIDTSNEKWGTLFWLSPQLFSPISNAGIPASFEYFFTSAQSLGITNTLSSTNLYTGGYSLGGASQPSIGYSLFSYVKGGGIYPSNPSISFSYADQSVTVPVSSTVGLNVDNLEELEATVFSGYTSGGSPVRLLVDNATYYDWVCALNQSSYNPDPGDPASPIYYYAVPGSGGLCVPAECPGGLSATTSGVLLNTQNLSPASSADNWFNWLWAASCPGAGFVAGTNKYVASGIVNTLDAAGYSGYIFGSCPPGYYSANTEKFTISGTSSSEGIFQCEPLSGLTGQNAYTSLGQPSNLPAGQYFTACPSGLTQTGTEPNTPINGVTVVTCVKSAPAQAKKTTYYLFETATGTGKTAIDKHGAKFCALGSYSTGSGKKKVSGMVCAAAGSQGCGKTESASSCKFWAQTSKAAGSVGTIAVTT